MNEETIREEATKYFNMDEAELYALLVPEHVRQTLFTKDGVVLRGREIFYTTFAKVRETICRQYATAPQITSHAIDLVVIISDALASSPNLVGIPVLPMAALIVKIGLEELCKDAHNHK